MQKICYLHTRIKWTEIDVNIVKQPVFPYNLAQQYSLLNQSSNTGSENTYSSPLLLNKITLGQHAFVAGDGLRASQFIFPHYRNRIEAVFTIGYGTQHGYLRSDQIFSIIHAHRHIGIYQLPGTHFNGFRTCSSSCINSSIATLTSEDFPQRRGEMRTKTQIIHQRIIHRCIILKIIYFKNRHRSII